MENGTKTVTLGFVTDFRRGEIWLAKKKTKLCEGKFNGYGGGTKENESPVECMIREFQEESKATTTEDKLINAGNIIFYFDDGNGNSILICMCYIFFITDFTGLMEETTEMGHPIPFFFNQVPYSEMMPADELWLKKILTERCTVSGSIVFDKSMKKVIVNNLSFQ